MRKSASIIFVILAVIAVGNGRIASADDAYDSVLGLLTQCREVAKENTNDINSAYWGLCHGRIEGYYIATKTWAKPEPFCLPLHITRVQIITTFIRWAEHNPEKWHDPAFVGLNNALSGAFPCQ